MIYKTQQSAFSAGNNYIEAPISYPNVTDVPPEPQPDPNLVCTYNVADISRPTYLRTTYELNIFKSMTIDGVLLDNLVDSYQFSSTGNHIVKYELYDDTKVGNSAPVFMSNDLIEVKIPNSVTTICPNAFNTCLGLTSITIPNSVTTIGDNAFQGCSGLISITIPDSVTTIGMSFGGCTSLISVNIPNSVTSFNFNAFNSCHIKTILIDNNTIMSRTYTSSANIPLIFCGVPSGDSDAEFIIGDNVTSIGNYAFGNDDYVNIKSITIGNSVTSIGNSSFKGSYIKSITIPSTTTSIGERAFLWCSALENVIVNAVVPPQLGLYAFGNNKTGRKIYVPAESVEAYKTANGWSTYSNDIEAIS